MRGVGHPLLMCHIFLRDWRQAISKAHAIDPEQINPAIV
jgi:hypothetical protein